MFFDEEYEYFDEDILENYEKSSVSVTKFLNEFYNSGNFKEKTLTDSDYARWLAPNFSRDVMLREDYTARLGRLLSQFRNGGKLVLDFVSPSVYANDTPNSATIGFEFNRVHETILEIVVDNLDGKLVFSVYSYLNDFVRPVFKTESRESLVEWINSPWDDDERSAIEGI